MLKTAFLVTLFLAIAIVGGGASVWYALDAREGVGAVAIGNWAAFPEIGTPDADPYSRARIAREGVLSLGRAEGLPFIAKRDSNGDILHRNCVYRIEGDMPPARFWTLYAADATLTALKTENGRPAALHSFEVLHRPHHGLIILAGPRPEPGNWLPLQGSGEMFLVLTLYDTAIASSTGIADVTLPVITKSGCNV